MSKNHFPRSWGIGLPLLYSFLVACHASTRGSFSGTASLSSGTVSASGKGEIKVDTRGTVDLRSETIFYHDGKLDYKGSINFEYDKADLKGDETFKVLEELKSVLKERPRVR
ncbi:MAG: hypothetical protein NZX77_22380, partial [Polyangiaceae bacterium]|nr:hypothetical protein [Polyangiaceae bacterium]